MGVRRWGPAVGSRRATFCVDPDAISFSLCTHLMCGLLSFPTVTFPSIRFVWMGMLAAWVGCVLQAAEVTSTNAGPATRIEVSSISRDKPLVNSLGMTFVPISNSPALFSIWETRVRDFRAFVEATGYDATGKMYSIGPDGWKMRGMTWRNPGFPQGTDHPVCGVSYLDAVRFCDWLTQKERTAGRLGARDRFRLPTDAEWSLAVGDTLYPWGPDWPPPHRAGNYGDTESDLNPKIPGYRDGFSRTSPVGSFTPNRFGIYDLGGNVWEWCDTYYRKEMNSPAARERFPGFDEDGGGGKFRVLRGGSWDRVTPLFLESTCRNNDSPEGRGDFLGFRCVLEPGASSPASR